MNACIVLKLVTSMMIMLFVLTFISTKHFTQLPVKPQSTSTNTQATSSAISTQTTNSEGKEDKLVVRKDEHVSHGEQSKRIPDVLILGVKKCGTQTLGIKIILSIKLSTLSFKGKFLSYHPNLAVTGEISFFENDTLYNRGIEEYVKKMPSARYL